MEKETGGADMTREELENKFLIMANPETDVDFYNEALRQVWDHDAEQRTLIALLKKKIEQQAQDIAWLKERDEIAKWYETLITRARIGTKSTPSMKVYIEQLEQQHTALREALQLALINLRAWNGEETWPLYKNSPEIRVIEQALTEHGGA